MDIRKALTNTAAVVVLFFLFLFPVGRLVLSDVGTDMVFRITSWIGLYGNQEPGDSYADAALLLSLLLALLVVWIANRFITLRKKENSNVQ
ncbi:hypothetical protein K788_00012170 [Paraburkholderia caribensis MBA4]|uniref:Transmembrane protein n=1 Tax=Paraburkholderia caribensis MBA4 TaxID=1323664 RepID=A0A0P0R8Z7_9BURK|nr:hypothetical protein [Paraburkholderia caribensis]ALL64814.1 hypothetical protein K788_00012170 [Paraburkholderia caribensis MBA4]